MKNFYLSMVIVLILCMVGWTRHANAQRSSSMNQTWEYHADPVPQIIGTLMPIDQANLNTRLINQRAAEGWELTAVGTSFFYFKRPKQ
jgi:hypothetical protein